MAKFMLIKISLMAEITDADALREAALKKFDAADITSDDYPDTADWHASEVGQEDRRLIATEDKTALRHSLTWPRLGSCSTGARRQGQQPDLTRTWTNWRAPRSARPATPGGNARGFHGWPTCLSRLTDAKRPEITTALCTAPRPATLARVRT